MLDLNLTKQVDVLPILGVPFYSHLLFKKEGFGIKHVSFMSSLSVVPSNLPRMPLSLSGTPKFHRERVARMLLS